MIPPNIASPPTNLRSGSSTENEGFALRRIQKHYRKKLQEFEILKYELQGQKIQNPKARNTLKDTRDEREGSAVRLGKKQSRRLLFDSEIGPSGVRDWDSVAVPNGGHRSDGPPERQQNRPPRCFVSMYASSLAEPRQRFHVDICTEKNQEITCSVVTFLQGCI